jgi:hydroxymethylpyrimidine pyrophosphatase-like HAD family hydrolase
MNIRLVCLDFDGTAVDYEEESTFFHPDVVAQLNRLKNLGVEWCTNSGRSREDQERILELSRSRGLHHMPAAILCSEAFIYDRTDDSRYASREPWNGNAMALLRNLHAEVQRALKDRIELWRARYEPDIRLGAEHTVFCVPGEDVRVDAFCAELASSLASIARVSITRNGGWVVVLPDSMGKGNVLKGYVTARGFSRDEVLAIGDHLNDLSMLDGSAARWVACPSDARSAVIETVRAAGGWVASRPGALGTAEVLERIKG